MSADQQQHPPDPHGDRLSRRLFLVGTGVASLGLVVVTGGQTWEPLAPFNVFAPRRLGHGPQGLPVNRTAEEADVLETAADRAWTLTVADGDRSQAFTLSELAAMAQTDVELPISCVEGWSTMAHWRGVAVRDLLAAVGIEDASRTVVFRSLQTRGAYSVSTMGPEFTSDPHTLVATELNGEPLHMDHGFPARVIAPARPGVLQTKWLTRIEVQA